MAKNDVQVNVRLPEWLLSMLRDAAERQGRSLTVEIATRLEDSFPSTLEDVQLGNVTNSLYVAQALRDRLTLRLDMARAGSAARKKLEQQLKETDIAIAQLYAERDRWIDKMGRVHGERS
jgi:hypothetical protein